MRIADLKDTDLILAAAFGGFFPAAAVMPGKGKAYGKDPLSAEMSVYSYARYRPGIKNA